MSATPTPSPLLVEIASSSLASPPWWGVPVVAGAFLLVGGWLSSKASRRLEDRKADREELRARQAELLDAGAALLEAGARIRNLGLRTLHRRPARALVLVAAEGQPLVNAFSEAAGKLSLRMPSEFGDDFDAYVGASLIVPVMVVDRDGTRTALHDQLTKARKLENRLRAIKGLEPRASVSQEPVDFQPVLDKLSILYAEHLAEPRSAGSGEQAGTDPEQNENSIGNAMHRVVPRRFEAIRTRLREARDWLTTRFSGL